MTKLIIASLMALGISASTAEVPVPVETVNQCIAEESEPEPMSCKASGHACEDREECCSRMCLKKEKKCG